MSYKKKLVVFTGAGVSAESGLKTFRDDDGLWQGYQIEDVATPHAWEKNPAMVLDFYNKRRKDVLSAQPNAAHQAIASWQANFNVQVITQNIDDLHERAGSKHVLHLHGEILKMRSEYNAEKLYNFQKDILLGDKAPDGGQFRPHVVWFEEPVVMMEKAGEIAAEAEIFVVIGTSLLVYPAAGLVQYASPFIPKFIIDKKIPPTPFIQNVVAIEQAAGAGVGELNRLLKKIV